ncbi:MAG: hypothetical protein MR550_00420, partial [Bacilli bacterium]|nr:hypothetical protein [Bacilli bacterium]
MKKYFSILINVIAILLLKYSYYSIIFCILSLIVNIIFNKKNKRILIFSIVISILIIITNILIIITNILILSKSNDKNIYLNENILLGKWIYNDNGGSYVFTDKGYTQYETNEIDNNYCIGKYEYSYGMNNDNKITYQDNKFYYYSLVLRIDYC